ncbi:hypothetical protein RI367_002677 [Sorochytrium milnesiophthora]
MTSQRTTLLLALAVALVLLSGSHASTQTADAQQVNANALFDCLADQQPQEIAIPDTCEPSDAVWDNDAQLLYVVSDDGTLYSFHANGTSDNMWQIPLPAGLRQARPNEKKHKEQADLEGCTLIPERRGIIYLANEYPPAILEYSLSRQMVVRYFDLSEMLGYTKDDGIESLTYIPFPADAAAHGDGDSPGWFYVGRQRDGQVFAYNAPESAPAVDRVTTSGILPFSSIITPPGPRKDLSAMYVTGPDQVWMLYDKPRTLVLLDATQLGLSPQHAPAPHKAHKHDHSADALAGATEIHQHSHSRPRGFTTLNLADQAFESREGLFERGAEAFAIAQLANETLVWVGIDRNAGRKHDLPDRRLLRYSCPK